MSYRLITTALLASLLAACATENTASHYATGDDAAVVKQGRNRSVAQLSESELRQHRRQRVDAAEILDRLESPDDDTALRYGACAVRQRHADDRRQQLGRQLDGQRGREQQRLDHWALERLIDD